ncbi:MAG TPA: serine/threonine-protein kinase [Ktedonobacteraceae bacterium]|nr:serine/threonine-protein kinase [Ktedonobacteraceae bacterium]
MENTELDHLSVLLAKARSAEEVFGQLAGTQAEMFEAARGTFRHMAKALHPDRYQKASEVERADVAFKKLAHFWEQARASIEKGTYGASAERFAPFTMRTRKALYTVERLIAYGDLCAVYAGNATRADGQSSVLLKLPLKPENNDLITNEARILKHLRASKEYEKLRHFVAQLVDAFSYQEEASGMVRQVNVLAYIEGLFSLKEVRAAYAQGVDARDMAWIWRRLLVALGLAHANNVLHGAVLPTHILIHPQQHGVVLIDWSYAVLNPDETGEHIRAISSAYRDWYPPEVFAKKTPTPGLDIAMAARCMIDLLGGDAQHCTLPETVPWQIRNHLKGCTLAAPQMRPQDVQLVLNEFDALIERLWGPRVFREFPMPKR